MQGIFVYVLILFLLLNLILTLFVVSYDGKKAVHLISAYGIGCFAILSYTIVTLAEHAIVAEVFFGLFKGSLGFLLAQIVVYCFKQAKILDKGVVKLFINILYGVVGIDALAFVTNPFTKIMFDVVYSDNGIMKYHFIITPYHIIHLCICYFLIAYIYAFLFFGIFKPKKYGKSLGRTSFAGGATLAVLAIFMELVFRPFDFSITPYVIGLAGQIYFFVLFVLYRNSKRLSFKDAILDEMDNAIVAFDNSDNIAYYNREARSLMRRIGVEMHENTRQAIAFNEFVELMNLRFNSEEFENDLFFKWEYKVGKSVIDINVSYKIILDDEGRMKCRYFLFSHNENEIDAVTGFQMWDNLKYKFFDDDDIKFPAGIIAFDLNKLSEINDQYGRTEGDKLVQILASTMVMECPAKSFFVKSYESNLAAICSNATYDELIDIAEKIKQSVYLRVDAEYPVHIQSAVVEVNVHNQSVINSMDTAFLILKKKNMLDSNAKHTSLIDSLIQMQMEADATLNSHVKRTRTLCQPLGKRMKLNDREQSNLELLCLIHDIGKIGIPTEIANKHGKYTADEWSIMKSHVDKGYNIADASEEFRDLAQCVRYHHENYDGSGYPDGLKGEGIPLLSRIIAVVESYDAMTSDRPYREAISAKDAREELMNYAGTQFDPHIVKEFIDMLDEMAPIDQQQEMSDKQARLKRSRLKPMGSTVENHAIKEVTYTSYVIDDNYRIISADENFEAFTGYTLQDLEDQIITPRDMIFEEDSEQYVAKIEELLSKCNEVHLNHRIRCKDGSSKYVFCYGRFVTNDDTGKVTSKLTITDISNTYNRDILANNAMDFSVLEADDFERDVLTGVLSFRAFVSYSDSAVEEANNDYILMFVSIDDFEAYNEKMGHGEGDRVLKHLADCINKLSSDNGIVGRLAQDRFGILLAIESGKDMNRVKSIVSETWGMVMNFLKDGDIDLSVSVGASLIRSGIEKFDAGMEKSLEALMKAKEHGKKCYEIYG